MSEEKIYPAGFPLILPADWVEKNKEKLEEAGYVEGRDYEVSQTIQRMPIKQETLGDLLLHGNRHARRKAIALANKVK